MSSTALKSLIISLALVAGACSRKVPQASRALAAQITNGLLAQPPVGDPSASPKSHRVYLDASISMKGFVNPAKHSRFDDFVDAIGDAMPGCQLFKYGKRDSREPGGSADVTQHVEFGLELHKPDFYDLSFNPDDRLVEHLAGEDELALSVLITDGVYSEPQGATSPPVVDAIQKWFDRGGVLGVLVLRSSFEGQFYSERGRTMLPKLSAHERPFYAFVFSPSERAFRDVQDKLKRQFPDIQTFLFSEDAVACVPDLNERVKGTYSYSKPPDTPFYWHMFDASLFSRSNPAPVGYRIRCAIAPEYPASELKFDLAAEYYRWDANGFKRIDNTPPGFRYELDTDKSVAAGAGNGNAQAPSTPDGARPDFTVYFPKDAGGDYGFYHLKLSTSPAAVRQEIFDLSTRDDRLPQNAGKTFRLLEFVSALTEAHFKSRLAAKASPSIFVTVTNH